MKQDPNTQIAPSKVWNGTLPSARTVINPDGYDNFGNPEFAVEDLNSWYKKIVAFRARKNRLPTPNEIDEAATKNPDDINRADKTTPDQTLCDGYRSPNQGVYAWQFHQKRPDGTQKPAFPKDGERDVWAYTDVYTRRRQAINPDGTVEYDRKGVYVVLWSDGEVEKFPFEKEVLLQSGSEYFVAFPGQAGLPKEKLVTEEELRKKHSSGKPLR